jgi:hypothetical protein
MSRIPRHFHFIFGLREQTEPFHLAYYLCLESCRRVNRPERMTLLYHYEPYGPYWEMIRGHLDLVRVPLNSQVDAYDYQDRFIADHLRYAHHADFIRLEKLLGSGGVYADIDTLFLRPLPDGLFGKPFVIGREDPVRNTATGGFHESLCNAFLMAEPGSSFARLWLERMAGAFDGSWSNHSCRLAHELAVEHPDGVHIEPASTFYPCMWTPEDLHALLEGDTLDMAGAVSVHLWSHLWWSKDREDFSPFSADRLTEEYIRGVDTSYNLAARPYLPGPGRRLGRFLRRLPGW